MVMELSDNDRIAMSLLLKYCFYRNWQDFLLINYANLDVRLCYGDTNDDIITDIASTIVATLSYLKRWTEGIDISNMDVDDTNVINTFNSTNQDRGALLIARKLFEYTNELQAIPDGANNPKIERLLRHIQRCELLIDLWYAGEDITYFGTMLGVR
jgi:hypothetical protein